MLATDMVLLHKQIEAVIRVTLDLGDQVSIPPDVDLISDVGLASIDIFEAIAALDTLLEAGSTQDIAPKSVRSIQGLSAYVLESFAPENVEKFLRQDVQVAVAKMRAADTL